MRHRLGLAHRSHPTRTGARVRSHSATAATSGAPVDDGAEPAVTIDRYGGAYDGLEGLFVDGVEAGK